MPVMTINVHEHKGVKPARLVAAGHVQAQLMMWMTQLRPKYTPCDCKWVFPSPCGEKMSNFSRKLKVFAEKWNIALPTPTEVRKTIITKSGEKSDADRSAPASSMSHTRATAVC